MRLWRRKRPGRRSLIERKHRLEGEIAQLSAELRRRRRRGEDASAISGRLERLRAEHYRTRLEIDRAEPGS